MDIKMPGGQLMFLQYVERGLQNHLVGIAAAVLLICQIAFAIVGISLGLEGFEHEVIIIDEQEVIGDALLPTGSQDFVPDIDLLLSIIRGRDENEPVIKAEDARIGTYDEDPSERTAVQQQAPDAVPDLIVLPLAACAEYIYDIHVVKVEAGEAA